MFFEFLDLPQMQRAFLIALIAGPMGGLLGSFIIIRRMSFLSDAIAHGAITGVTLGIALRIASDVTSAAMQPVLIVFCIVLALAMAWLLERTTLHADSIIAFSYTGSMALGAVVISRLRGYPVLESALFGDILAAAARDVWMIAALACIVVAFLALNMRALTLSMLQESLARLEGFNTRRLNYLFIALLISGMLVVPAAAARLIAGSFRTMLALSAGFGLAAAAAGVAASYHLDAPTGPTIVLAGVLIFGLCLAGSAMSSSHGFVKR
jgi:zinc transport system permease protein